MLSLDTSPIVGTAGCRSWEVLAWGLHVLPGMVACRSPGSWGRAEPRPRLPTLAQLVPGHEEEKLEGAATSAAGLELVPCREVKLLVWLWPDHPGPCGSGGGAAKASPFYLWFPTAEGCSARGSGGSHIPPWQRVHPLLPGEPLQSGSCAGHEARYGHSRDGLSASGTSRSSRSPVLPQFPHDTDATRLAGLAGEDTVLPAKHSRLSTALAFTMLLPEPALSKSPSRRPSPSRQVWAARAQPHCCLSCRLSRLLCAADGQGELSGAITPWGPNWP